MTDSQTDWRLHGVRVVRAGELDTNTAQTPGMSRAAAINFAKAGAQKLWAGTVTIHPDAKTGAHHHGALESVIYVVRGKARMRWGERLEYVAEAGPGDFIFVPPWVPHQEINASPDEPLECVLVRSDQEAVVVNLDIEPVEQPETRGLGRSDPQGAVSRAGLPNPTPRLASAPARTQESIGPACAAGLQDYFRPRERIDPSPKVADEVVPTTCYMCACRCGIRVHRQGRRHPLHRRQSRPPGQPRRDLRQGCRRAQEPSLARAPAGAAAARRRARRGAVQGDRLGRGAGPRRLLAGAGAGERSAESSPSSPAATRASR